MGLPDFSESLTRGIGFKLRNAGEFVDFRIDGLAGGAPVSLGAQTIFFHDDGVVKYTASGPAVKEDIVFNKRPLSDTISFTVSSSDLLPERTEEGGYRLYSLGGLPVFEISPPKVYDANGRAGKAVLDMQAAKATLTVDSDFLAKAAYPITVDPTVVVLGGGESSLVSQRNSFFDGSRYWVLYSDGTDYRAKSSTDTVNWTPASGYIAGVPAGVYLGAYYDGGATVYAAYRKNYYSIYARRGVISGANIAWDASDYEVLAGNSASNAYAFPSISRDTNNKLWVSARYYDGSTWKARTRRATGANSAVSWSTSYTVSSNSYSSWLIPQAVPLPGGAMYFMYNLAYDIRGRYYTGSAFNAEQLITYTDVADFNHIPSAVADASNTVYMGYTDTSGSVKYRTLESTYTTWSGAQTLAEDTGAGVALTLDTGKNDIYAYYGHGIGGTGDQVRAVKLGEPKRKTIASDVVPPFGRVDAQTSTWVNSCVTTAAANETPGDVVNTLGSLMDATIAKFYVFSENKPD